MKKCIVLCADDYGQAPAISQGILTLLQGQRLSAVSCMVTSPDWPEQARWLAPYQSQVDIGLHFNLTNETSLSRLMLKSILRQLNFKALVAQLHAQIDLFTQATGYLPQFIDGHQHVHQFPVIRDALIKVYQQRFPERLAYIRLVNPVWKWTGVVNNIKKVIIHAMGTKKLTNLLTQHHIPHNHSFSGIYSFREANHYAKFFPTFLAEIDQQGIIMCHPGLLAPASEDPITEARYAEYTYFMSDQFITDCQAQKAAITPFKLSGGRSCGRGLY